MGWQDAPVVGKKAEAKPAWQSAPVVNDKKPAPPPANKAAPRPAQPAQRPSLANAAMNSLAAVGGTIWRGAAGIPDMAADLGDMVTGGVANALGIPQRQGNFRLSSVPDKLGTPRPVAPGVELGGNLLGGAMMPGPKLPPTAQVTQRTQNAMMATEWAAARAAKAAPKSSPKVPVGANQEVIAAGKRTGVPVRLPDAVPATADKMAVAEASPYSGPIIRSAIKSDNEAMAGVVRNQGTGNALTDNYAFGQVIQDSGRNFIKSSGKAKNAFYNTAERLAGGARVVPNNAIAEIDKNIASLSAAGENTNSSLINYLKGLRADMAKEGGFSITEFQNLRSGAKAQIKGDNALTVSNADRILGDVAKKFTADAGQQLPRSAAMQLQKADAYYAKRQDYINNILKPFLGTNGRPKNPEAAARAFSGMVPGNGNYNALKRFLGNATEEEVGTIRSTIAENLVAGPKGDVGAAQLATNIAKVPRQTLELVFGKEGASALNDVKILATAKGNAIGKLNHSRSGVVTVAKQVGLRATLSSLLGLSAGGGFGAVAAPIAAEGAAVLGQARTARLLLNPNFTKLVRSAPNSSNPAVIQNWLGKLALVASINEADRSAIASALSGRTAASAAASNETGADNQQQQQALPQ